MKKISKFCCNFKFFGLILKEKVGKVVVSDWFNVRKTLDSGVHVTRVRQIGQTSEALPRRFRWRDN
jgi:hypothetical protein